MTIRRKTTVCGSKREYVEVEIFPFWEIPRQRKRKSRYKETSPVQKELNDKHAKKYFARLAECNFGKDDWFLTLTYDNEHHPESIEEAEHQWELFSRRVKRLAKKKGCKVRFLEVTEQSAKGRFHHHVLFGQDCGLSREEIMSCWHNGWCDCKEVWEDREKNVARLAKYMTKTMSGTRRWKSSRGLKKPQVFVNDNAISNKRYRELSLFRENSVECRKKWEELYPGYEVIDYENYENAEYGGNYISVKLRRVRGSGAETEGGRECSVQRTL